MDVVHFGAPRYRSRCKAHLFVLSKGELILRCRVSAASLAFVPFLVVIISVCSAYIYLSLIMSLCSRGCCLHCIRQHLLSLFLLGIASEFITSPCHSSTSCPIKALFVRVAYAHCTTPCNVKGHRFLPFTFHFYLLRAGRHISAVLTLPARVLACMPLCSCRLAWSTKSSA